MVFAEARQESPLLPPARHNFPHSIHPRPSLARFERRRPDRATDRPRQSPSHAPHTKDRPHGENPDTGPLPFGFGTHPYFRVPLGGTSGAECRVTVPVEDQWELEGLLPTGRKTSPAIAELVLFLVSISYVAVGLLEALFKLFKRQKPATA